MLLSSLILAPFLAIAVRLTYLSARPPPSAGFQEQRLESGRLCKGAPFLIVYASQTGAAQRLAELTARAFEDTEAPPLVVDIAQLDAESLIGASRILFVVSTYGDGEPPDSARGFAKRIMRTRDLTINFAYGVLALGDRQYPDFCQFGRSLDAWLHKKGGVRLFDTIFADGQDMNAEEHWCAEIWQMGATIKTNAWRRVPYQAWQLCERQLLNPESQGLGAYHIRLKLESGEMMQWKAGDILEIMPRNDPAKVIELLTHADLSRQPGINARDIQTHLERSILPTIESFRSMTKDELTASLNPLLPREYSIASIPEDGHISLLVRQRLHTDGAFGLASGWLTTHAKIGSVIEARIRSNPRFHGPSDKRNLILIGNGTGLAGLRAHLREQAQRGHHGHWLIFGERNAQYDAFFQDELRSWLSDGLLDRLDLAYSRDAACGRYVQHLVQNAKDEINRWVAMGASILVCGSRVGMAPAVDIALRQALPAGLLELMSEQGRYARDVY